MRTIFSTLLIGLLAAPMAFAEVTNNVSIRAESGQGSSATASYSITTVENGVVTHDEGTVTSTDGSPAVISTGTPIVLPESPVISIPTVVGGADAASGVGVPSTPSVPTVATPANVSAGARVSISGDVITITLPAGLTPSPESAPQTLKISRHNAVNAVVIADIDGDGALERVSAEATEATAKRPKEIIVVGTKVRSSREVGAIVAYTSEAKNAAYVENDEDLALLAARAIVADERMADVAFRDTNIDVTYQEDARLFGVVPVGIAQEVSVSSDGRVTVRYPWWGIFAKKRDLAKDVEAAVRFGFEESEDAIGRQGTALARQARMFQTLSNVMKARHDAAMNSIRNMK